MRIVVDTNVLVGACMGTGAPAAVVEACICGKGLPIVGNALLSEYEDVLSRETLFDGYRLTKAERFELLDIFLARCQWSMVYFTWRPNLRDEADNHLVELAVAGGADAIVTRNLRDLGRMELRFPQLKVLGPEDFLKEI
jgi:putative PIN family toxin of toxin-antitoxin system